MTHTCTNHVPGMYSCYARHACRCHDCREAARRVHKRAQHARRQGIPSRVAADPARRHVVALLDAGMGRAEVARLAGVSPVVITRLIRGDTLRLTPESDRRLRGVPHRPIEAQEVGMVSACGSIRRLRALAAVGWTFQQIAEQGAVRRHIYSECVQRGRVYAATRAAIADVYSRLWDETPPDTTPARRARLRAQREGWPPPLAWDDGHGPHGIDNPAATPHPWKRTESSQARRADVVDLVEAGVSLGGLIERGITPDAAEAALRRAGRHDLAAQIRPLGLTHANQYTKEAA